MNTVGVDAAWVEFLLMSMAASCFTTLGMCIQKGEDMGIVFLVVGTVLSITAAHI